MKGTQTMLRLTDSTTGQTVSLRRPPGALARLCVTGPPRDHPASAKDLRALLVADVVRRVGEDLHQWQVSTIVVQPASGHGQDNGLDAALAAFWIPPPSQVTDTPPEEAVQSSVWPTAPGTPEPMSRK